MPGDASRFNGIKGGRPKGKKSPATLKKEAVLKAYRERVMGLADRLLDSQLTLAKGITYLYKIEKKKIVGPKGGIRWEAQKPERVTSEAEIRDYLEGLVESGDVKNDQDPSATYYFLTTKDPDSGAIKDMMDRTFGKSVQAIVTKDEDDNDMPIGNIMINPPNVPKKNSRNKSDT